MTNTIEYRRSGHTATLVLNNPERHNSLGRTELDSLRSYLDEVSVDQQVRVLVVTGAGQRTFCAGASLPQLDSGEISGECFQSMTDRLSQLSIPTICALNGNVFGGGVELALSCDFRIGIEGMRMRVPAAAIGLCYPLSGINRFVERLGVNVAKRILVSAEEFDAETMLGTGFLDHVVMRAQLEEKTAEVAGRIAVLAPLAVRSMKRILQQAASGEVDEEEAARLAEACLASEDLQEGFAAQREKRPPRFSGS